MNNAEIKYELGKRGWTPSKVATKLNESRQLVSLVINQITISGKKTEKIQIFISKIINLPIETIFNNAK